MSETFTPIALQLHSLGLQRLHDPNWTGMDLFDRLKQHVRGRIQPVELLRKPLERGLPYYLGCWFFEEYFYPDHIRSLDDEYRAWYLEDLLSFFRFHRIPKTGSELERASNLIRQISALYERDEHEYFSFLESEQGSEAIFDCAAELLDGCEQHISGRKSAYAENYSDRVVHDRELCGYIAEIIIRIGFDGDDDDSGVPQQWVERVAWPERIKSILRARERGKCAKCGADLVAELEHDIHIDHIISITHGGCNDIVNLQILCGPCNLKKSTGLEPVRSSVPEYIKRRKRAEPASGANR